MSEGRPLGARLVVSFELAKVSKLEGMYHPELTVEQLLLAIEEYARNSSSRAGHYDEEISNPFLCVVDSAIATAAQRAIMAIFTELNKKIQKLESQALTQEHENPDQADKEDVPF